MKNSWKFISTKNKTLDGIGNYEHMKKYCEKIITNTANCPSKRFIRYYDKMYMLELDKKEYTNFFLKALE